MERKGKEFNELYKIYFKTKNCFWNNFRQIKSNFFLINAGFNKTMTISNFRKKMMPS